LEGRKAGTVWFALGQCVGGFERIKAARDLYTRPITKQCPLSLAGSGKRSKARDVPGQADAINRFVQRFKETALNQPF